MIRESVKPPKIRVVPSKDYYGLIQRLFQADINIEKRFKFCFFKGSGLILELLKNRKPEIEYIW